MIEEKRTIPVKLLEAGFIVQEELCWPKYNYRISDGWFGCTVYHPDNRFALGDYVVDFSLQGITAGLTSNHYEYKAYKALWETRGIKMIRMTIGKTVVYKSLTGELPMSHFVDLYIAEALKQKENGK